MKWQADYLLRGTPAAGLSDFVVHFALSLE